MLAPLPTLVLVLSFILPQVSPIPLPAAPASSQLSDSPLSVLLVAGREGNVGVECCDGMLINRHDSRPLEVWSLYWVRMSAVEGCACRIKYM